MRERAIGCSKTDVLSFSTAHRGTLSYHGTSRYGGSTRADLEIHLLENNNACHKPVHRDL